MNILGFFGFGNWLGFIFNLCLYTCEVVFVCVSNGFWERGWFLRCVGYRDVFNLVVIKCGYCREIRLVFIVVESISLFCFSRICVDISFVFVFWVLYIFRFAFLTFFKYLFWYINFNVYSVYFLELFYF